MMQDYGFPWRVNPFRKAVNNTWIFNGKSFGGDAELWHTIWPFSLFQIFNIISFAYLMRYMTYNLSMCWFLAVCPNQKSQWDIGRTENSLINIKITFTWDNLKKERRRMKILNIYKQWAEKANKISCWYIFSKLCFMYKQIQLRTVISRWDVK